MSGRIGSESKQPSRTSSGAVDPAEGEALGILESGGVLAGQLVPWSSNGTFFVQLDAGQGKDLRAIYKPRRGERPLHDFPSGTLYKREYAAYLVSRSLGWPRIPATVVRDGPYGVGSMQLYIESDPNITYFDLAKERGGEMLPLAVFDLLTNNADRKGGHCILGSDGKVWSIDHGLTFHNIFKLRTVMLEFWGAEVPGPMVHDLAALRDRLSSQGGLAEELRRLVSDIEYDALVDRIEAILREPLIPELHPGRNVPWPLV